MIRTVKPQRVVCQCPERNYSRIYASHPDHLAAAEAALCAVYPDARNPFTFTELLDEGFEAWTVPEVWMTGGPSPKMAMDITDTIDRKIAALMRHESQFSDPTGVETRVRALNLSLGEQFGLGAGRSAEVFQVIDTR